MEDQISILTQPPKPTMIRPGVSRGRISHQVSRGTKSPPKLDEQTRWLDACELREVFADISTRGREIEATCKDKKLSSPEPALNLTELFVNLIQRKTFGAQISYQYDGKSRLDTIITTDEGICCIRTELPN